MAYVRKTYDEWSIEAYYHESDSWEYVVTAEDRKNARELYKDYIKNDHRPYRIVKHRIPIK